MTLQLLTQTIPIGQQPTPPGVLFLMPARCRCDSMNMKHGKDYALTLIRHLSPAANIPPVDWRSQGPAINDDRILKSAFLILTLVLPLATPFWASAQETITITEGSVEPTPIAIANFTGLDGLPSDVGRTIAEVISNDLKIPACSGLKKQPR